MESLAQLSALTFGIQAFVTLLVILDPPGATPIFLSLAGDRPQKQRVRMAWTGSIVSLIVIVTFALFGQLILDYLHVSIQALQGAGGLLLLLIALELLTGKESNDASAVNGNVAMVPLGTPILAGPGAIVTTMLFVQSAHTIQMKATLAIAIVLVHVIIAVTLIFSTKILGLIRPSGVTLLARVIGLLLSAIAVEMIVASIKGFFNIA